VLFLLHRLWHGDLDAGAVAVVGVTVNKNALSVPLVSTHILSHENANDSQVIARRGRAPIFGRADDGLERSNNSINQLLTDVCSLCTRLFYFSFASVLTKKSPELRAPSALCATALRNTGRRSAFPTSEFCRPNDESGGQEFESLRARQSNQALTERAV
jgi:hypothetical protein